MEKHFKDTQRRMQAKLASEVASGFRSRAHAREEYRAWIEANSDEVTLVGIAGGGPARVSLQQREAQPREEERSKGQNGRVG
jgi:hypothetical protein